MDDKEILEIIFEELQVIKRGTKELRILNTKINRKLINLSTFIEEQLSDKS